MGKKGVMPPQFAKNAAAMKSGKSVGGKHKQIAKHVAAIAKHSAQMTKLFGK